MRFSRRSPILELERPASRARAAKSGNLVLAATGLLISTSGFPRLVTCKISPGLRFRSVCPQERITWRALFFMATPLSAVFRLSQAVWWLLENIPQVRMLTFRSWSCSHLFSCRPSPGDRESPTRQATPGPLQAPGEDGGGSTPGRPGYLQSSMPLRRRAFPNESTIMLARPGVEQTAASGSGTGPRAPFRERGAQWITDQALRCCQFHAHEADCQMFVRLSTVIFRGGIRKANRSKAVFEILEINS